jgi:hypothetical protein
VARSGFAPAKLSTSRWVVGLSLVPALGHPASSRSSLALGSFSSAILAFALGAFGVSIAPVLAASVLAGAFWVRVRSWLGSAEVLGLCGRSCASLVSVGASRSRRWSCGIRIGVLVGSLRQQIFAGVLLVDFGGWLTQQQLDPCLGWLAAFAGRRRELMSCASFWGKRGATDSLPVAAGEAGLEVRARSNLPLANSHGGGGGTRRPRSGSFHLGGIGKTLKGTGLLIKSVLLAPSFSAQLEIARACAYSTAVLLLLLVLCAPFGRPGRGTQRRGRGRHERRARAFTPLIKLIRIDIFHVGAPAAQRPPAAPARRRPTACARWSVTPLRLLGGQRTSGKKEAKKREQPLLRLPRWSPTLVLTELDDA